MARRIADPPFRPAETRVHVTFVSVIESFRLDTLFAAIFTEHPRAGTHDSGRKVRISFLFLLTGDCDVLLERISNTRGLVCDY